MRLLLAAAVFQDARALQHGSAVVKSWSRRTVTPCLQEGNDEPLLPIDFEETEREQREDFRGPKATPDELAQYLPPWAQQMMLDPEANAEYEEVQVRSRSAALYASRVEGRTWEETSEHEQDPAGMAQFTAEEIGEDYQVPVEAVCAELANLGITPDRLKVRQPVKSFCTPAQVELLLQFVSTVDPIAAREEYVESTLAEIAEEELNGALTGAQLVLLCSAHGISAVLGPESRVRYEDHPRLMELAAREAAFLN